MPTIPAMVLTSNEVDVEEIYENGLYHPANPPDSLEILHGGMGEANYGGGDGSIPPYAVQYGAMVSAFYIGFDRWEFIYAKQLSTDENRRILIASLSRRFWLPWEARFVMYGYQAWMLADATLWDTDGVDDGGSATPAKREFWELNVHFDGTRVQAMESRLPCGRNTVDSPDTSPFTADPGYHTENRWRFPTRTSAKKTVAKGNHSLFVSLWAGIIGPDQKNAKVTTPCGGLWLLAFR